MNKLKRLLHLISTFNLERMMIMNKLSKKEQRTDQILLSLKKLDFINRTQLQTLHDLGSDRNARKVMQNLGEYVHCFRDGEKVYYLSKEGRERVDCSKV